MPIVTVDELTATRIDYLIIGGGTAGLVVAARLTEDPDVVVAVLEAGKYHKDDPGTNIPGLMAGNIFKPDFDWGFWSVPQEQVNNRQIAQSRGKGLGGCSALNFTAALRPTNTELDAVEEMGNPGWNWENIWNYMKKSERLQPPQFSPEDAVRYAAAPDHEFHGVDGPVATSFTSHIIETHPAFLDALEKLGLSRNPETGGGTTIGSLLLPTTVDKKTMTRSYSASAYYAPNEERSNFLVVTEAHVTKVMLEQGKNGLQRAVGVEFVKDGETRKINASKEVILSAGTFQSPQILELSGVGNKGILNAQGIETIIDLSSVGENLQDHAMVPTIIEVDERVDTMEKLSDDAESARHMNLLKEGKGLFSAIPSNTCAFIPAHIIAESDDIARWKALATIEGSSSEVFENLPKSVKNGIQKQYKHIAKCVEDPASPMAQVLSLYFHYPIPDLTADPSKRYMTNFGAYTHPFARGSVHITSPSPFIPPAIKQNYLTNRADLEILVKMQQFLLKMYDTSPAKELIKRRVLPPEGIEDDLEALEQHVRNNLVTIYHPVGTCSMLPKEDGGVVDPQLLVYGTENLRVIDCSVLPIEASCNIQTLAYAIGEKGADIIKGLV